MRKRLLFSLVLVALVATAIPAGAEPRGFIEDEFHYGFFYGTFDESPNTALFAGGPIEDFCTTDPGKAPLRVFFKHDETVDLKVNTKDQSIYLYETASNDIPTWLGSICPGIVGGGAAPQPFATGSADLKVRISVLSEDVIEVFNSVNGIAASADGTTYKVTGSADLVVIDGIPQGNPADFVGFKLTEIRR